MNDETRDKILSLLEKAKSLDPGLKQFGASSHRYELKSPIPITRVKELEKQYDFTLPEEYFWFITQLGNGGAGPSYGLFQFGNVVDKYEFSHLNMEPLLYPDMKEKDFKKLKDEREKLIEKANTKEEKEDAYLKYQQGLLLIGTHGMHSDMYLIVSGNHRGKIMFFDTVTPPKVTKSNSFIDWYINWLDLTIKMFEK